jgi:hypothetical protein
MNRKNTTISGEFMDIPKESYWWPGWHCPVRESPSHAFASAQSNLQLSLHIDVLQDRRRLYYVPRFAPRLLFILGLTLREFHGFNLFVRMKFTEFSS